MAEVPPSVQEFITNLRRRHVSGSTHAAKRTAELLRQLVSTQRLPATNQAEALLQSLRTLAPTLISANPSELAVGNIIRRVLHIIREEDAKLRGSGAEDHPTEASHGAAREAGTLSGGTPSSSTLSRSDGATGSASMAAALSRRALLAPSLYTLLGKAPPRARGATAEDEDQEESDGDPKAKEKRLKHAVIEGINDLLEEIDNCKDQLAGQATDHIHQNQVIITAGRSQAASLFLKEARRKRHYQAIVAEGAPGGGGHLLAKELSAAGVPVTLIPDSAVFAMMARANLAVVSAHAVLANGGVIAPLGSLIMAMAAKRHSVPLVVLAGMFQMSCHFPQSSPASMLNDFPSPCSILSLPELAEIEFSAPEGAQLEVRNPTSDYVPPELISLLITDTGGHMPSYVYRLLSEYYHMEDHTL